MNQIIQNLNDGKTSLVEVPMPLCSSRSVLIQTSHTLVSLGTEKMLVEFAKGSFLQKAKQQPDKVKEVIAKVKTDGLAPTIAAVKNKLDQPICERYQVVKPIIINENDEISVNNFFIDSTPESTGSITIDNPINLEFTCFAYNVARVQLRAHPVTLRPDLRSTGGASSCSR